MPPVIVGVAAGIAAATVVTTAAAIAIGVAAAAFTYAMTQSMGAENFANEAYSQQQMLRSPSEARRGIYGKAMVSGPLIFAEETGTDNEYLHLVIALAGHQCDGIEKIYFGDEKAWTEQGGLQGKYSGSARINIHLGDQQSADPQLMNECSAWTNKHIGYGVTYLYVRLKHDTEVFPNGIPNIKALVRGKPVYDPRLDTTAGGAGEQRWDDASTWTWSDNWALCVLDYTRFEAGIGAMQHEIALASYVAAANDSDQQVEYQEGKFESRYTCSGTYKSDTSPASVLEKLLSAGAGMQVYVSGQYHLYAGVYQGPATITLSEDDCAGDIEIKPYTARASLCNAVRGTFVDPENFYQPSDFPPHESTFYRDMDNGEYIDHDIDLPFTQSSWTAQRLAKLHLELNRAGMQVDIPLKMIGLAVSVGKVVHLTLPSVGIDGTFMVVDWHFDFGKPVKVSLKETSAAIFDFAMGSYTSIDLTPNTNLPDPSFVPTVSNLLFSEMGDDANWQGQLSWAAPGGNSAYRYRVEVVNALAELAFQANPDQANLMIPKLDEGSYTISVWAVNMFANRSNIAATIAIGAKAPPAITAIDITAGALELTLRPSTAALLANTTEFEVYGSLANDFAGSELIGKGKEVLWPGRHPNTSYYVWARTVNNFGHSAWFGPVLAKTSDDPSAIVNLIENEIGTRLGAYTWFAWADDDAGTGFTTDKNLASDKAFMGVANEQSSAAAGGNWQDYTWSRIKAEIDDVFTPSEQTSLDNLMAGKLPSGSKDLLALQDALNNNSLSNDLLDANKLLTQGINAEVLGGETPANAQAKADAAKTGAITEAKLDPSLANNVSSDGVTRIAAPEGGRYQLSQSSVVGALKIKLPQGFTSTMMSFFVDVFDYQAGRSFSIQVSGYNYSGGSLWYNETAKIIGDKTTNYTVRFGHEAGFCCIWIGDDTSVFAYPSVAVRDVVLGYSNNTVALWASGWEISFGVITGIVQKTLIGNIVGEELAQDKATAARETAIAATSPIKLNVVGANTTVSGNTCRHAGLAAWEGGAYSAESFTSGAVASAIVSEISGSTDERCMMGLGSEPTSSASFGKIEYALYATVTSYAVYEKGGHKISIAVVPKVGDVLVVEYDGINVRYFINGEMVRSISAPADQTLHFDSSFYGSAFGLSHISLVSSSNLMTAKEAAVTDIAAGHFTASTALIQKLIADSALFNQVQAQLGLFGGIAANAIAAKAITTDKLHVLARNLLNNFTMTGETTGWTTRPLVNHVHNGKTIKAMEVKSSGNSIGYSDYFDIDHSKIYEINFTIYRKSGGDTGTRYFGMSANGSNTIDYYHASSRLFGASSSNFYFWVGDLSTGSTRQMRAYIVGSEVDIAAVPDSLNVNYICKLRPDITQVRLRALNYYNAGVETIDYWFNPSVTELGGGVISAYQLLANSGLFNTLKSRLAAFGGLTANELNVDTALITKLVGSSALFNQLVAQLGTFGGLTANAIAADAIEGRHFKANQLIEAPVIEGGEVRLVGTAFMKVMASTAFGPDALVEWYGPKLLIGNEPDWNNLKKSNAITYLSATGDAYFGGTLSAGILKNGLSTSDKNVYTSNSYPVTVGPFGTNGKAKTVIVSFNYDAVSNTTTNPGTPTTPSVAWQLERKIGSGSWGAITSGTFTGTTTSRFDGETGSYFVTESCSGASSYTDNSASTSNFNYRIKVTSANRYHHSNFVTHQILSLYSTEQ